MTHRLRRVLVLLVLIGLFAGGLTAPGRADPPPAPPGLTKPKPCKPVLACDDDVAEAIRLEGRIADNLYDGQLYEINYGDASRTLGDVASVHHFGDSALWTGTYLAAQSFRYATASKYLAQKNKNKPLSESEIAFWTAQRDEAKVRVDAMVQKYNVLVNISKLWHHTFAPSLSQPGFGGGVIDGEPGYLMRACVESDAPYLWNEAKNQRADQVPYTDNRRVFGPFHWPTGDPETATTTYFCENGTSRDAYAGTTFGLLTAFDLMGEDYELRHQIRDDVLTLVKFAVKHYWSTPRPHGRISLPLPSSNVPTPGFPCTAASVVGGGNPCGHDFENFISPLFVQVPLARLNMAQAARHVIHAAPPTDEETAADPVWRTTATWDAVWTEELATQLPVLALSMEVDAFQPNESYYKFNLHHLTGYNVTRLEQDPAVQAAFKQALSVMDRTTGDDVNAHFEAITHALTGDEPRRDDAVEHLRQWRAYRARVEAGGNPMNSARCGTSLECVPRIQLEVIREPAPPVVFPDPTKPDQAPRMLDNCADPNVAKDRCRARRPLPVAERATTDFLWQRPPTQLDGGEANTYQPPGVDYLLPYWMLRYYTEAAEPIEGSFPVWPGPAHA